MVIMSFKNMLLLCDGSWMKWWNHDMRIRYLLLGILVYILLMSPRICCHVLCSWTISSLYLAVCVFKFVTYFYLSILSPLTYGATHGSMIVTQSKKGRPYMQCGENNQMCAYKNPRRRKVLTSCKCIVLFISLVRESWVTLFDGQGIVILEE